MITNFKVFEQDGIEESHIETIDFVIDCLINEFSVGDIKKLKELLMKIDRGLLIGSLSEEKWKKYTATNKEDIVEELIFDTVLKDHRDGDYTILDELLGFIPEKELKDFIPEDWVIKQDTRKYNL